MHSGASSAVLPVPSITAPVIESSRASSGAPPSKAELAARAASMKAGDELELGEGVVMRAVRVGATEPTTNGWQRARSASGGFSVELPAPFNEAVIRAPMKKENTELRTYVVSLKTPGALAWTASCIARADGLFLKPDPEADALPRGKALLRPIETKGSPIQAYQREVALKGRRCFLIVEAQGTDPLPPKADRDRYFDSFKVEGDPVF